MYTHLHVPGALRLVRGDVVLGVVYCECAWVMGVVRGVNGACWGCECGVRVLCLFTLHTLSHRRTDVGHKRVGIGTRAVGVESFCHNSFFSLSRPNECMPVRRLALMGKGSVSHSHVCLRDSATSGEDYFGNSFRAIPAPR